MGRERRVALAALVAAIASLLSSATQFISVPAGMFVTAGAILILLIVRWDWIVKICRGTVLLAALVCMIALLTSGGVMYSASTLLRAQVTSTQQTSGGKKPGAKKPGAKKPGAKKPGAKKPGAKKPENPPPPPSPPPPDDWSDHCSALPGADTPALAETFRRLYLGEPALENVTPPPGAKSGGCTGPTTVYGDDLAFVTGMGEDGTMKSLGLISKIYGVAMFLAPAARRVREMIKRYRDLGGWPRTLAGHGDYYGIKTPFGTGILMRSAPVLDNGSGRTQGYVWLPPAAASLWIQATRLHGSWLWARFGGIEKNGEERIKFVSNLETNQTIATIFVDRKTGTARKAGQISSGSTQGPDISQDEVQSYAKGAR